MNHRPNGQLARILARMMSSSRGQSKSNSQVISPYHLCKMLLKLLTKKPGRITVTCMFICLETFLDLFNMSLVVFRYYFPTYENDILLCTLSDSESDLTAQEQNGNITIISEDTSKLHALKQTSILNQLLLHEGLKN